MEANPACPGIGGAQIALQHSQFSAKRLGKRQQRLTVAFLSGS